MFKRYFSCFSRKVTPRELEDINRERIKILPLYNKYYSKYV